MVIGSECEAREEFGPPRKAHHPEYPFWRLQNYGIWEVTRKDELRRRARNTDPLKSELLEKDVHGGFTEVVYAFLPDERFLSWHRREVFRGPARERA